VRPPIGTRHNFEWKEAVEMIEQNNFEVNNLDHIMENLWQKMDMDKKILKAVKPHQPLPQEKKRSEPLNQKRLQKNMPNIEFNSLISQLAQEYVNEIGLFYDRAGQWWHWQGNKWQCIDKIDILSKIVIDFGYNKALGKGIKDMLFTALQIHARRNQPKEIPKNWICFADCIYDLEAEKVLPISPEFFITSPIPWKLGKDEKTPTIDNLLKTWGGKNYEQLLQVISYTLLPDYSIHRIFILLGEGGNGKGTYMNLIQKFISGEGSSNVISIHLKDLARSFFIKAELYRKLACFVTETDYGILTDTSFLKQITGEDLIQAQRKYQNPFYFKNYAKVLIATNSLPPTCDKTTGFYRRAFVIEFQKVFERNTDVISQIPDYEFENLGKKCLTILKQLLRNGKFTNEGSIEERRQKYENLSNPLKDFISLYMIDDPNGEVLASDFFKAFCDFLEDKKWRQWNYRQFSLWLENAGYERRHTNKGTKWLGLNWRHNCHCSSISNYPKNQTSDASDTNFKKLSIYEKKFEHLSQPSQPSPHVKNKEVITIDDDFSPEDVEPVEEQCI